MINITDAWFLSRISDSAAAAVGAVLPILGIAFALYSTLHQAGNGIAGQRLGAKDFQNLAGTYGVLFCLTLIAGVIMAFFFILGSSSITQLIGLSDEMMPMADIYLSTLGIGTWVLALRFGATTVLASLGKTKWNMFSTGIMSVVNIIFNYILIDGKFGFPALGIQGIAFASVIAWSVSLLFSLGIIFFHFKISIRIPVIWDQFKDMARPMMKIAIPSIIEPMSWQFTQLIMTVMVISIGDVALATRIYTLNLLFVAILYGFAISAGVQIKVAFLIGAQAFDKAQSELVQGVKIGLSGVIIYMAFLLIFSPYLFNVFTADQRIWTLGASVIIVACLGEFGRSFNLIVGASLRATGDARYTSIIGFISMWFIGLPLAWFFGLELGWGLVGIWIATSCDEMLRGATSMLRWNSKRWQTKGLYSTNSN